MKKSILLLLFTTTVTFGQVGIGTLTPVEALHVAGSTSTIRVEGLNTTNNVKNNGVSSNVVVDANGNLKIENQNPILIDNADVITGASIISLSTTGAPVTSTIYTTTITVNYERLVSIKSAISASIFKSSGVSITDDFVRMVGANLYIDTVVKDRDRATYSNKGAVGAIIAGPVYLKNDALLLLTAGIHTISIEVFVMSSGTNATYATFGNGADIFKVVQL